MREHERTLEGEQLGGPEESHCIHFGFPSPGPLTWPVRVSWQLWQ